MRGHFRALRMALAIVCLIGVACLGALGADETAAREKQYVIETMVYTPDVKTLRLPDGISPVRRMDFKADEIVNSTDHAPGVSFFGNAEFTIGNVRVVMKGDSLTWNGEASPDPAVIPCLTSPKLTTIAGQDAMMQVGAEGIQYFEQTPDGLFELKTKQVFTGYKFSSTATPAEGSKVHLKWSLETHRVKERTPIPGVQLEIGLPTISTRKMDSNMTVKLGDWRCFVHTAEDEALLIFIRVTESEDGEG